MVGKINGGYFIIALLLLLVCLYILVFAIKYLRKGQIKLPSIWMKKPYSFKKNPAISSLVLLAMLSLVVFFLMLAIIALFFR